MSGFRSVIARKYQVSVEHFKAVSIAYSFNFTTVFDRKRIVLSFRHDTTEAFELCSNMSLGNMI